MKLATIALLATTSLTLAACGGESATNNTVVNTLSSDPIANYGTDLGNYGDVGANTLGSGNALDGGNAAGGNTLGSTANTLGNGSAGSTLSNSVTGNSVDRP